MGTDPETGVCPRCGGDVVVEHTVLTFAESEQTGEAIGLTVCSVCGTVIDQVTVVTAETEEPDDGLETNGPDA